MTLSAKTIRTAIAAALAAAAVLTTVAIPAQAEYKRATKITKAASVKRVIRPMMKKYYVLKCLASSGDVVAHPLVINTSGKILPIGRKIQWKANMADGSIKYGTHTLTAKLYVGQSRHIPATLHWKFTCKAGVMA
ncbi:MAG: hypothetical protein O7I42_05720 [Alphaproteobacteria bacterium]|nr:hypothetical protein [Alphaproteobacteria bacterium]